MTPTEMTTTLLRASAGGFAGLTASRTAERSDGSGELAGGFDAWRAHFKMLIGELAAAADDGSIRAFATTVGWTRDAFLARGLSTETLSVGLDELRTVLEESLPSSAWKPLPPYFEAARSELVREDEAHRTNASGDPDDLVESYLARLQEGDAPAAIATVTGAVESGALSVTDALAETLPAALHEIGRRWHSDVINVAQEHFATQVSGRLLERLLPMAPACPPNGHTVMLTMVEGDAHEIGLRIVAAMFELDGWRTICLGANVPSSDLPRAVDEFGVELIVLGATLNTHREPVARAIAVLRDAHPSVKILSGGRAFADSEQRALEYGADGCVLEARRAVELGRGLVES